MADPLQAIRYASGSLQLLDQRLLPRETVYLDVPDLQAAWQQIKVWARAEQQLRRRRPPLPAAVAAAVAPPARGRQRTPHAA